METITCTKCAETKPLESFYADKRQSSGFRPDCKECQKKRHNEKYRNDPVFRARHLAQAAQYQKTVRKENTIRVLTILKENGCIDCGERDPVVLDFDHQRDKVAGISKMVRNHASWETIEAEIAKCAVRCSNCHRRKTAKDRNYYADIDLAAL